AGWMHRLASAIGLGASTQLWGELSANGPSEQAIGLRHVVWRTPRAALAIEAELRHTPGDMTTSAPMLLFVGPAQGDVVAAGAIASALYVGAGFGSSTFALDAGAAFGTDDANHGVTPIAGVVGRL